MRSNERRPRRKSVEALAWIAVCVWSARLPSPARAVDQAAFEELAAEYTRCLGLGAAQGDSRINERAFLERVSAAVRAGAAMGDADPFPALNAEYHRIRITDCSPGSGSSDVSGVPCQAHCQTVVTRMDNALVSTYDAYLRSTGRVSPAILSRYGPSSFLSADDCQRSQRPLFLPRAPDRDHIAAALAEECGSWTGGQLPPYTAVYSFMEERAFVTGAAQQIRDNCVLAAGVLADIVERDWTEIALGLVDFPGCRVGDPIPRTPQDTRRIWVQSNDVLVLHARMAEAACNRLHGQAGPAYCHGASDDRRVAEGLRAARNNTVLGLFSGPVTVPMSCVDPLFNTGLIPSSEDMQQGVACGVQVSLEAFFLGMPFARLPAAAVTEGAGAALRVGARAAAPAVGAAGGAILDQAAMTTAVEGMEAGYFRANFRHFFDGDAAALERAAANPAQRMSILRGRGATPAAIDLSVRGGTMPTEPPSSGGGGRGPGGAPPAVPPAAGGGMRTVAVDNNVLSAHFLEGNTTPALRGLLADPNARLQISRQVIDELLNHPNFSVRGRRIMHEELGRLQASGRLYLSGTSQMTPAMIEQYNQLATLLAETNLSAEDARVVADAVVKRIPLLTMDEGITGGVTGGGLPAALRNPQIMRFLRTHGLATTADAILYSPH